MKKLLVAALVIAALLVLWGYYRGASPLEVVFEKPRRETLVSTLVTNGKAEPVEWVVIRAQSSGPIDKLPIERGQAVTAGAILAQLDTSEAASALASAEARIAQAR